MNIPAWMVWPYIVIGWAAILGFACWGTAWFWWTGITLWLKWHQQKPDEEQDRETK